MVPDYDRVEIKVRQGCGSSGKEGSEANAIHRQRPAIAPFNADETADKGIVLTFRAPKLPGRNDPCPCGSGRKYKACCGRN